MAYRFTNTDKWNDAWFCELRPLSKLLFLYLCDQCDVAGFLELNTKKIAFEIGIGKQEVERSLKEMGDRIVLSVDCKFIFIRNFTKHQKNKILNESNMAHVGILNRLNKNLELFNCQSVNDFFEAPLKPLNWGLGISIGKSIVDRDSDIGGVGEKEEEEEEDKSWRDSFSVYSDELRIAYDAIIHDSLFISERERYHPNVDIVLSIEKAYRDFWSTEAGWKNKKKSKSKSIDWVSTFKKALDQKFNQVYRKNEATKRNNTDAESAARKQFILERAAKAVAECNSKND